MGPSRLSRLALAFLLSALAVASAIYWLAPKVARPTGHGHSSSAVSAVPEETAAPKTAPVVQVYTDCPDMPIELVERTITNRIKRRVSQTPGAVRVASTSERGGSLVTVYFRGDVDPQAALTLTNKLAMEVIPSFPEGVLPPVVLPCPDSAPRAIADIRKLLCKPDTRADCRVNDAVRP